MTAPLHFSVTLRHLSSDARTSGVGFAEVRLDSISSEQPRTMIEALADIAPTVEYPAVPELRIASGSHQFVILVRAGRVQFSSWSAQTGGGELTPAQIHEAITGAEAPESSSGALMARLGELSRGTRIVLLALGIIGSNALTAWLLTRQPPDLLLPEYRLLEPEPGKRLLADLAGEYVTGAAQGDRGLTIRPDGSVRWVTFGNGGSIEEESELVSQPVLAEERPGLLTPNRALISVKDPVTVVYFGDTYRRKTP